jgi:hypothetical protein
MRYLCMAQISKDERAPNGALADYVCFLYRNVVTKWSGQLCL